MYLPLLYYARDKEMITKFIGENYIGTAKERANFKNNLYNAVYTDRLDLIYPELYAFLENYGKTHPSFDGKSIYWADAISDNVKAQNQHVVDECVEFAKKENIAADFYYNGLRCQVDNKGNVKTEPYEEIPFGTYYIGIKMICGFGKAYEFEEIAEKNMGYIESWDNDLLFLDQSQFADCHCATEEELSNFCNAVDKDIPKYIYLDSNDIPDVLMFIQKLWSECCRYSQSDGRAAVGESIDFIYCDRRYKMPSANPYLCGGDWRKYVDMIIKCLELMGAKNICVDYGRTD